ncbi:MAG: hypothetical protein ACHQE5_13270, partial [Actinomycetes bacterium]
MTGVPGAWLGVTASVGILMVLSRLPLLHRVRLQDRVLPYLRDLPGLATPSRGTTAAQVVSSGHDLPDLVRRIRDGLAARLDRALGGAESVRRRLDQLGHG